MEPVYDVMARHLTGHFGVPEELISPDVTFAALDFDSLARVELAMMLEETFGVTLSEDRADMTLGEAAEYLTAAVGAEKAVEKAAEAKGATR